MRRLPREPHAHGISQHGRASFLLPHRLGRLGERRARDAGGRDRDGAPVPPRARARSRSRFPGGMVDPGEIAGSRPRRASCSRRRGYGARRLDALGSVNPNPALFGEPPVQRLRRAACERVAEIAERRAPRRRWSSWCRSPSCARRCARARIDHGAGDRRAATASSSRERGKAMKPALRDARGDAARRLPRRLPAARRRDAHLRAARRSRARALPSLRRATAGSRSSTFSHEPSVGFAADGYARSTRKLGVVCVTYGAGGHNVVNPIAGAYAEQVPLLVVSGGPGDAEQKLARRAPPGEGRRGAVAHASAR